MHMYFSAPSSAQQANYVDHRKMKQGGEEKNEQNQNLMRRGLWTEEEDRVLSEYISVHGGGRWNRIPKITGLKRCGKSCRLRWLNYLSPTVKRGDFSHEEEDLIIRLHKLLGNRWSLIAGRVPGRTDNQVKNHWNTHLSKRLGLIKNQNLNKRLMKRLSTVHEACSSPHHQQPAAAADDQINRPSSSTVSNSTSTFSADHQQDMGNKDKVLDNNLEQHSPDDDDDDDDDDQADHEDDPLMTSRISSKTTTYSSCYGDPYDSLLHSSTRHSHHLDFFEFFDSSTFDMNRL